jgi:hypothetical protein
MLTTDPNFNNQITYDNWGLGGGDKVLSSFNGEPISLIETFLYLSLRLVSTLTKQIIICFSENDFVVNWF